MRPPLPGRAARALLLPLLLLVAGAPPARAQAPDSLAPADSLAPGSRGSPLDRVPVVGEVVLLGRAGAHVLSSPLRWGADDLRTLGVAAGGVAAVSLLDEWGRDLMARNQAPALDEVEEVVEPFGRERALQLVGGLYLAGLVLDDARLRAVAAEGAASALVAAGVIQPLLAEVSGRPRPRRNRPAHTFDPFSGSISFPSGHTTTAFSLASVLAAEYPHPAVGVAAYGVASAVGLARMYRGAHFVSDVVAAAVLGTAVGRATARFGPEHRARLRLEPAVRTDGALLAVRLTLGPRPAADRRPQTDDRRP